MLCRKEMKQTDRGAGGQQLYLWTRGPLGGGEVWAWIWHRRKIGGKSGENSIPSRRDSMGKGFEVPTSLTLEEQLGDKCSWSEWAPGKCRERFLLRHGDVDKMSPFCNKMDLKWLAFLCHQIDLFCYLWYPWVSFFHVSITSYSLGYSQIFPGLEETYHLFKVTFA